MSHWLPASLRYSLESLTSFFLFTLYHCVQSQLCGKTLEGEEKFSSVEDASLDETQVWADQASPKMDALCALVESLTSKDSLSEEVKTGLKSILESRSTDKWAVIEAENARLREEAAKVMEKAAPKKSAAIRIEVHSNAGLKGLDSLMFNCSRYTYSPTQMTKGRTRSPRNLRENPSSRVSSPRRSLTSFLTKSARKIAPTLMRILVMTTEA